MERLCHDLNLALEESSGARAGRRKFGFRRRTRSTGNLPASCGTGVTEDGSSSSPPQPPLVSQILSDSDDPQVVQLHGGRGPHCRASAAVESDSFNEAFSPCRPPAARRKRKFKKVAMDYSDHTRTSPPHPLLVEPAHMNLMSNCSMLNVSGPSPLALINKKKRIFKHTCQDRSNIFCGKRKWSNRERSEVGEMRERSFSGGCSSKSYYFTKGNPKSYLDFKNTKKFLPLDKVPKFKDKHGVPVKCAAVKNGIENALQTISLSSITDKPSIPGSSTFNFVYHCPANRNGANKEIGSKPSIIKIATELPPFFSCKENENMVKEKKHSKKHDKSHNSKHKLAHLKPNNDQLRNPLQFDDPSVVMDCSMSNDLLSSSSLSSSDSEGVVTNDSDREGDDELTDWPGNEEISSFNKSLNIKGQRPFNSGPFKANNLTVSKNNFKKDKFLPKQGINSCKNKPDCSVKVDLQDGNDMQMMDDDTMMSDSGSVLDTYACLTRSQSDPSGPTLAPQTSFTSFGEVKNAGLLNNNANEAFFHSFQAFQDKAAHLASKDGDFTPRTSFNLQKTSSSDLNVSEKSPQSDHCYSEHSVCLGTAEIREIRAGCRRIREERPGFTIVSAANEQLSRFLRDPSQEELKLPGLGHDQGEREKLASLAKLYSLELRVEMGRPVLRKTINTTQSVRMEHTRLHRQKLLSDFKRRRYGNECNLEQALAGGPDVCPPCPCPCPLSKAVTLEDLSAAAEDPDQGFSEPNLLEAGCFVPDPVTAVGDRPDLLSHVPLNQHMTDSSSVDLAELD